MENNEEKKELDFMDEKEPIDSIEKTVADLKKKIQELSEEKENEEVNIPSFVSNEKKAKIHEIYDNTMNAVSESINDIKEKTADKNMNADLAKTVEYIQKNAMKAVDLAKVKINELKEDPRVKEAADTAEDAFKKAGGYASKKASEAGEYLNAHLSDSAKKNLKNTYEKTNQAVTDGSKKLVDAANDFMNREDVQKTLSKVKDTASSLADKGAETMKKLFKDSQGGE